MRVVVCGGSGFIGRALCEALRARGDEVTVLSRQGKALPQAHKVNGVVYQSYAEPLPQAQAVVNLAGASIAAWPLTARRMRTLVQSRLEVLSCLERGYGRNLPEILIQASGSGVMQGPGPCADDGALAENFYTSMCLEFELRAEALCRRAGSVFKILRLGVVVGAGGGLCAITSRLPPFALWGAHNYVPYILLEDTVRALILCLDKSELSGPILGVSPHFKTVNELLELCRPTSFLPRLPIPQVLLRALAALGDHRPALLLCDQKLHPGKLLEAGLRFTA